MKYIKQPKKYDILLNKVKELGFSNIALAMHNKSFIDIKNNNYKFWE